MKVISKETGERRISLLVNQVRTSAEAKVVYGRIAQVAKQFLGVSVLDAGYLPTDEAVTNAVRRRNPFVIAAPSSPASHCIAQLAMRLEQGISTKFEGAGFFNRMSKWFRK